MVKPSTTSRTFHEIENIEFPEVPPQVLEHDDLEGQVEEMKKWFKAWANQDASERNYTEYFKVHKVNVYTYIYIMYIHITEMQAVLSYLNSTGFIIVLRCPQVQGYPGVHLPPNKSVYMSDLANIT